jgi:hypothetical protein
MKILGRRRRHSFPIRPAEAVLDTIILSKFPISRMKRMKVNNNRPKRDGKKTSRKMARDIIRMVSNPGRFCLTNLPQNFYV